MSKEIIFNKGDTFSIVEDFTICFRYTPLYTNFEASYPRTVSMTQTIEVLNFIKIENDIIYGKFIINSFKYDKNYGGQQYAIVDSLRFSNLIKD